MVALMKQKKIFFFYVYISLFMILCSRWTNLNFSLTVVRIFTLFLYAPFIIAIFWKLLCDVRVRPKNLSDRLYYAFAFYYCILCAFRFLNGLEVKESLYYSIILFGSLAVFMQFKAQRLQLTQKEYATNFLLISIYTIISVLIYRNLLIKGIVSTALINNVLTSTVLILLFPFVSTQLCSYPKKSFRAFLSFWTFSMSMVIVAISSSRAAFLLTIGIIICLLIVNIKNRQAAFNILSSIGCAILIVGLLFYFNYGGVRYAIYRECNIFISVLSDSSSVSGGDEISPPIKDAAAIAESQLQIESSDLDRAQLIKLGIEQVRLNPWFGTGDVMYDDEINGEIFDQSPHNLILETLICYGIIGFLLLAVLFVSIMNDVGLFSKDNRHLWKHKVYLILTILYFMGIGSIQMIAYSVLITPLLLILFSYYRNILVPSTAERKISSNCN